MVYRITSIVILLAAVAFAAAVFVASAGAAAFGLGLVGFGQTSALLAFGFAVFDAIFGAVFTARVIFPYARSILTERADD